MKHAWLCMMLILLEEAGWFRLMGRSGFGKTNIHPQVCSRGGGGGHLGEEAHPRVHTSVRTPIIFFLDALASLDFKLSVSGSGIFFS